MTRCIGPRAAVGGLLVLALALSACSSSTGGASPTPPRSKAADLALAKKGLIVLGDLPGGWTATGKVTAGSGSGNDVPTTKIAACLGIDKSEITTQWPTENSPTFADAQGRSAVTDQVETFPSAARAGTDFSTFSNARTPSCITTVLGPLLRQEAEKGGGAGTTVGAITATRETFPSVGDRSGEIQLEVPITVSGVSTSLSIDLVEVTKGDLETTLTLTADGTAVDQTLARQTATAAVRRMS